MHWKNRYRSISVYKNALKESEENYRRIVETANEGIWVVDPGYNVTFANWKVTDILGYSQDELIGRNAADFFVPGRYPGSREQNAYANRGE